MNEGRLAGKVALVTGAARGRGRSHAVRLAAEGADVVLVDLCDNIPSCDYPLATAEDLDLTASMVEKLDRTAVVYRCDVCDRIEMEIAIDTALRRLGALDVVVASASINPSSGSDGTVATFVDTFDVDFLGVVNTFTAAIPRLRDGGSLVASGPAWTAQGSPGPGHAAYALAQSMVVQYVQTLAKQLAHQGIRVNTVSGSGNGTGSGRTGRFNRPVVLATERWDDDGSRSSLSTMPWPNPTWADTDASAAVAYLAADESGAVTGRHMTVDAGMSFN